MTGKYGCRSFEIFYVLRLSESFISILGVSLSCVGSLEKLLSSSSRGICNELYIIEQFYIY